MFRLLRRLWEGQTEQGLRSTFREWAAERANFPREIVDIALAVGHHLEAANARDEIIDKRRELMDAWAAACGGRSFRPTGPR
jgi:hypothetical protein